MTKLLTPLEVREAKRLRDKRDQDNLTAYILKQIGEKINPIEVKVEGLFKDYSVFVIHLDSFSSVSTAIREILTSLCIESGWKIKKIKAGRWGGVIVYLDPV